MTEDQKKRALELLEQEADLDDVPPTVRMKKLWWKELEEKSEPANQARTRNDPLTTP